MQSFRISAEAPWAPVSLWSSPNCLITLRAATSSSGTFGLVHARCDVLVVLRMRGPHSKCSHMQKCLKGSVLEVLRGSLLHGAFIAWGSLIEAWHSDAVQHYAISAGLNVSTPAFF